MSSHSRSCSTHLLKCSLCSVSTGLPSLPLRWPLTFWLFSDESTLPKYLLLLLLPENKQGSVTRFYSSQKHSKNRLFLSNAVHEMYKVKFGPVPLPEVPLADTPLPDVLLLDVPLLDVPLAEVPRPLDPEPMDPEVAEPVPEQESSWSRMSNMPLDKELSSLVFTSPRELAWKKQTSK